MIVGSVIGVIVTVGIFVIIGTLVRSPKAPAPNPQSAPSAQATLPPPILPGGGRTLFPDRRLVALYGIPNNPALGALGEQPMQQTIDRVKQLAHDYQPYSNVPMLPTLEIIATIASGSPTSNDDYSLETDPATLTPWLDAARDAGVYTVLDLQPGRSDFLTQAKEYAGLLKRPGVGLALDPEWRLGPDEVPLQRVGSVDVSEINVTAAWLAGLTKQYRLPQKLLLIHQFRASMIANRQNLDTSHPELGIVIQMDGKGAQSQKQSTWQAIRADAPANVRFGWKDFYDEDQPMLTPEQTMAVEPQPWYVSYQ